MRCIPAIVLVLAILGCGGGKDTKQAETAAGIPGSPITLTLVRNYEHVPEQIECISLSSNGQALAAGCRDGTVKVWDTESGKVLLTLQAKEKELTSVAFSPDRNLLACSSKNQVIRVWELPSGNEKVVLHDKGASYIQTMAFLPDSKSVVAAYYDGIIKVWDLETKAARSRIGADLPAGVEAMALSPDGKLIAAGRHGHSGDPKVSRVVLVDLPDGKPRSTVIQHTEDARALAFTSDGKFLAVGGGFLNEGTNVTVWEVATGQKKADLKGHPWDVQALAFSPDGKYLASGDGLETTLVWDWANNREIAKITHEAPEGTNGQVRGLVFGPDGKTLYTGGWQKDAKRWVLAPAK